MAEKRVLFMGIAIAVIVALGAAIMVSQFTQLVPVVVATVPIEARTPIQANQITVEYKPAGGRHAQAFTEADTLVGQYTLQPIAQGEQVIKPMIAAQGSDSFASTIRKPDYRVVALPADDYTNVGGILKKGDKVDIAVSFKRDEALGAPYSNVVLQQVEFLGYGTSDRDNKKTVLLQLRPQEGVILLFAHFNGRVAFLLNGVNAQPTNTNGMTVPGFFRMYPPL